MKTRRLIIASALGLIVAAPAFAAFVEGTIDLEKLRQQPAAAQPADPGAATAGAAQYEGQMYEQLANRQRDLASTPPQGLAGPAGPEEIDAARQSAGPNESIYEQIRREFH